MAAPDSAPEEREKYGETEVPLPRIAIKFCVQCKWNLRAAYVSHVFLAITLFRLQRTFSTVYQRSKTTSLVMRIPNVSSSHTPSPHPIQYAQELLSTFSTALGEVALIPATGGTFTITLLHRTLPPKDLPASITSSGIGDLSTSLSPSSFPDTRYLPRPPATEIVLWDRKAEGGFPETKELKSRVRNVIEPGRDLGHVDRSLKKAATVAAAAVAEPVPQAVGVVPGLESGGGRVATSTTVQWDAAMSDIDPTVPAEKCAECQQPKF